MCRKHGQSDKNILRLSGEQVIQKNSVNKSDARQKRMRLEK